ncbi:unnamed protein product [Durusdinium trenchii]|uniref:Uncharacterized protein n=1 Tax=Durusdinium trenchii TaxID=1381693 RepID=A0ABP0MXC4_9DINO
MGNFGHESPKQHVVWSNDEGMLELLRERAGYMSVSLPPPKDIVELDYGFSDAEIFLDKCTMVVTSGDGMPLLGICGDPCKEVFWPRAGFGEWRGGATRTMIFMSQLKMDCLFVTLRLT